jgi:prophage regulatory protein
MKSTALETFTPPAPRRDAQAGSGRDRSSGKIDELRVSSSELPTEGFVRLITVLSVIPVSKSTWWAGVSSGRFPQPVKLGPRITAWRVQDIRRLLTTYDDSH